MVVTVADHEHGRWGSDTQNAQHHKETFLIHNSWVFINLNKTIFVCRHNLESGNQSWQLSHFYLLFLTNNKVILPFSRCKSKQPSWRDFSGIQVEKHQEKWWKAGSGNRWQLRKILLVPSLILQEKHTKTHFCCRNPASGKAPIYRRKLPFRTPSQAENPSKAVNSGYLEFYGKFQDFFPVFFPENGEKPAKPHPVCIINFIHPICPQVLIFRSLFYPIQKILSFSYGA